MHVWIDDNREAVRRNCQPLFLRDKIEGLPLAKEGASFLFVSYVIPGTIFGGEE